MLCASLHSQLVSSLRFSDFTLALLVAFIPENLRLYYQLVRSLGIRTRIIGRFAPSGLVRLHSWSLCLPRFCARILLALLIHILHFVLVLTTKHLPLAFLTYTMYSDQTVFIFGMPQPDPGSKVVN